MTTLPIHSQISFIVQATLEKMSRDACTEVVKQLAIIYGFNPDDAIAKLQISVAKTVSVPKPKLTQAQKEDAAIKKKNDIEAKKAAKKIDNDAKKLASKIAKKNADDANNLALQHKLINDANNIIDDDLPDLLDDDNIDNDIDIDIDDDKTIVLEPPIVIPTKNNKPRTTKPKSSKK